MADHEHEKDGSRAGRWFSCFCLVLALLPVTTLAEPPRDGCRFAYTAPTADNWAGRLLFGCRDPVTAYATTYVLVLSPQVWTALTRQFRRMAVNEDLPPAPAPAPVPASACDRWTLWAADEGPRAPVMTREAKLARVCP